MKKLKTVGLLTLLLIFANHLLAQTRVFEEVAGDILSKNFVLREDRSIVGYLRFSRLEKVDADSFKYKISVMDENLNDLTTFEFKGKELDAQNVQYLDEHIYVLYLESEYLFSELKKNKEVKEDNKSATSNFLLCKYDLDGNLKEKNITKAKISNTAMYSGPIYTKQKIYNIVSLDRSTELFVMRNNTLLAVTGDDTNLNLTNYDKDLKVIWQKVISDSEYASVYPNPDFILVMQNLRQVNPPRNKLKLRYKKLSVYNGNEMSDEKKFNNKKYDINLRSNLNMQFDDYSRQYFLTGNLPSEKSIGSNTRLRKVLFGKRINGVFSYNFNTDSIIITDWVKNKNSIFDENSRFKSKKQKTSLLTCVNKDSLGNTIFLGNNCEKKFKPQRLLTNVGLSALIFPAGMLTWLVIPITKVERSDLTLIRQKPNGSFEKIKDLRYDKSDLKGIANKSFRFRISYSMKLQFGLGANLFRSSDFVSYYNSINQRQYYLFFKSENCTIYNASTMEIIKKIDLHRKIKGVYYNISIDYAKDGYLLLNTHEYDSNTKKTTRTLKLEKIE